MAKLKLTIKKLITITLSFCLTANTALANTYKETQQMAFFRTRDNYQNNLNKTFYDDKHKLYSLLYYVYGDFSACNDTLYLIKWNKDNRTSQELKVPKKISDEISKYHADSTIQFNPITSNGNIWMTYAFRDDTSDNYKNFFIRISPKGKLLSRINIKKIFGIPKKQHIYYNIHQYKKNKAFVQIHIDKLNRKDIYMAGVIDYKKNKLVWKRKISDAEGFYGGYSYDFGSIAKNKYMIGFNNKRDKFVISEIRSSKVLKELDLNSEEENIYSYEYKNNALYIVKKDGVYKLKWDDDKMTKLIDLQDHWINKGHNYATDITVVDDNELYVIGYDPGESEKHILFSFKK